MYGCMYGNTRWRFGVSTPTKRWPDFSGLLHLIRVLKLKLSAYSSSFQPRAQVVRFVTLVNLPFQFYSEVSQLRVTCYGRSHVYMFIVHAFFSSFDARRCQPTGPLYTESFVFV